MIFVDQNNEPPQAELESGDMFDTPAPVPPVNIDDGPLKCVQFNEQWGPVIALALERLTWHDAWAGADADVQRGTQQIEHFISLLLQGDCP